VRLVHPIKLLYKHDRLFWCSSAGFWWPATVACSCPACFPLLPPHNQGAYNAKQCKLMLTQSIKLLLVVVYGGIRGRIWCLCERPVLLQQPSTLGSGSCFCPSTWNYTSNVNKPGKSGYVTQYADTMKINSLVIVLGVLCALQTTTVLTHHSPPGYQPA